jgi:LmbE family N-acetylglucosaminyl deacetylase
VLVVAGGGTPHPEDPPASALAVYAHPDDPEVSVGGTLSSWAAAGSEVHLLICTSGEKGQHLDGASVDGLAEHRAEEVAAAATALGLTSHAMLGLPDGEVENDEALRLELVRRIRGLRPEAVVAPDPTAVFFGDSYINHRDHRQVGWAVLDACAPAAGSPQYFPEAGEAHQIRSLWLSGTLHPDVWVDVEPQLATKAEALRCHHSQLGEGAEVVHEIVQQRAEDAARPTALSHAESFRRLRFG